MKKYSVIVIQGLLSIILALFFGNLLAAENHPFPQNISYSGIKPNNETLSAQNDAVSAFYDYWKGRYLKLSNDGHYYVHGADTYGSGKGTSESHGYGMLLTVLMAGHNQNAKQEFDGLYHFFDTHRSSINNQLMGWFIDAQESGSGTFSSATDGDMDIAYALLLADKQWGSAGSINYLAKAIEMINSGIRTGDYNEDSRRLMLGDWDNKLYTSRSSDWMPGHLRAYANATGDSEWLLAIDEIFTMVAVINNLNNNTGLMPDFVTGASVVPDYYNDNETGEDNPGYYYYNAARTPMRLAMDYIHNGNTAAKDASDTLTTWVKQQVGENYNFNNYYSGYTVQGVMLQGADYNSTVFIAPVIVAASVNPANQDFVNAGWNYIKDTKEDYFEDSINLLSMLALTGNWWAPNQTGGGNGLPVAIATSATTEKNMPVTISLSGFDSNGTITAYTLAIQPNYGTITLSGNQATYTPGADYVGADSVSYTVTDNDGNVSAPANVSLTINDSAASILACAVNESVWNDGFVAYVTVTNTSNITMNGWQVVLTLGDGEQFDYGWSANFDNTGALTASHVDWNQELLPGASTDFGLLGSYSGNHLAVGCQ